MIYQPDFFYVVKKFDVLIEGFFVTLRITGICIPLGLFLGVPVALARLSKSSILRNIVGAYVAFFRCTPLLVQLFWFYYALPIFIGYPLESVTVGILTLSLYGSVVFGESFRAGIQSVPGEQYDAATALGLSSFQRFRYVVLPQVIRIITPVLITWSVSIFKESSLVSVVGVMDLMLRARILASDTYRPIEVLSTAAVIYFIAAYPITAFVRIMERKFQLKMAK